MELTEIHDAVTAQDALALDAAVDSIATFVFESGGPDLPPFPEELFEGSLVELRRREFLKMSGGFVLPMLYEYEWARLSSDQRYELLVTLRETYDELVDWMTCFVYVELMGRFYHNEAAYDALLSLAGSQSEASRSLVPMGIEKLIAACENSSLRDRALQTLREFEKDSSASVRAEAKESLNRVENRISPPDLPEYRKEDFPEGEKDNNGVASKELT